MIIALGDIKHTCIMLHQQGLSRMMLEYLIKNSILIILTVNIIANICKYDLRVAEKNHPLVTSYTQTLSTYSIYTFRIHCIYIIHLDLLHHFFQIFSIKLEKSWLPWNPPERDSGFGKINRASIQI